MNPTKHIKESRSHVGAWEMRDDAATRKLTEAQLAEVSVAITKHNTRRLNRPVPTTRTTADIRAANLYRINETVGAIARRLYRTASGRWAGGQTTIKIKIDMQPAAWGESSRAWSSNGKWAGLNAYLSINVQPAWTKYVQNEGLAEAAGLLTTHAKRIDANTWAASWVEQGRGFDLNVKTGVIHRSEDGSYIHAASMIGVAQILRKRERAAQVAALQPAIRDWLRSASVDEVVSRYGAVVVKRAHSLKAGNCVAGTDSFINRYFAGRTAATVAELAPLYNVNRSRIDAAVLVAILEA